MAPVRPAAAAPTIAPAVVLRSDLRVSALLSAEDSTALRLDETDFLRTFGMRHLTHPVFFAGHPHVIPHPSVPACGESYSNSIFPAKLRPSGQLARFREEDLSGSGRECFLGLARFHLS